MSRGNTYHVILKILFAVWNITDVPTRLSQMVVSKCIRRYTTCPTNIGTPIQERWSKIVSFSVCGVAWKMVS